MNSIYKKPLNGWKITQNVHEHYKNGELHREDGAAIVWTHERLLDNKAYYLNGIEYSEPKSDLEWAITVNKWREAGCVTNGFIEIRNNLYHYKNDLLHREDGPAYDYLGGNHKQWWLKGVCYLEPKSDLEWELTIRKWKWRWE